LHALWTLRGLKALDEPTVLRALADAEAGMRENALLLAEEFLPRSKNLQRRVLILAKDADARVRFQASLTLGQFEHPDASAALLGILRRDHAQRWARVAALSSVRSGEEAMLRSLLEDAAFQRENNASKLELAGELADLIGARSAARGAFSAVLATLAASSVAEPVQVAALNGLHAGLMRAGRKPGLDPVALASLEKMSSSSSPVLLTAAWKVTRVLGLPENKAQQQALAAAAGRAGDLSRTLEDRVKDVQLLAMGNYSAAGRSLLSLLEANQPAAIQLAAVEALRQFSEPEVAKGLVEHWRGLAPAVRSPVINLLLLRISFHEVLIAAIEKERIRLGELALDLEQRRRLLRESTPEVKARAAKLIGDEEYSNRKTIVTDWLGKLPAAGDASRGRPVFEKICAQCHLVGGIGYAVGPDLGALGHRSVEDLASNILDPNMAINPNYISYTVETTGGEIESGILQSESPEAISLLQALGRKIVVPRRQIKRLESTGLSLMPEGLEAGMTPGDLRDVIAFIQQRR
jgi:putative heme-binding domain-containing protein